jgi:Cellulase (glycosyl hydrolase family 5)
MSDAGTRAHGGAPTRRRGALLALLACTVTLSCAAGFGVCSSALGAEAGVNLINPGSAQIAATSALGTHWVRMFAPWPDFEPARGAFAENWFAQYESVFAQLPAGTKVIIDVVDTPSWETGSSNIHTPPANVNDYAAFIAALAQRWANRVTAFEVWNEEDGSQWWPSAPNAASYVQLLKAAYPAIKRVDPRATVVLGGLVGNDYPFLESVYADGGKGFFDVVGVHTDTACNVLSPYEFLRGSDGRMIPDSFLAYREIHQTMLSNGDEKPIWMTETSWATTNATCSEGAWAGQKPQGVTLEQQATFLAQEYHCMKEDPYLSVALWFPLQDGSSFGFVSGLLKANGAPKPSYAAMSSYAHNGDQLTEPCGTFSGPRITVRTPTNRMSYEGVLPIVASATSAIGVSRITLKIDGRLIRNFIQHPFPTRLVASMHWFGAHHIPFGWHTLTFLAYDREGNVAETSIAIHRGVASSRSHGHSGAGGGHGHSGAGTHGSSKSKSHGRKHKRKRRRHRKH